MSFQVYALSRVLSLPRRRLWRARITRWQIGYPDPEMRWLSMLCDPDALSIDVGASLGAYTVHLLAHSRFVWAFEPRSDAARELARMLAKAPVVIRAAGLSDETGTADFRVCEEETGRSTLAINNPVNGRHEAVPVYRLDDLSSPRVGFLKIDVEGHEEAVLRGAWETILRDRPTLLIEIEERHNAGATHRVPAMLAAVGYRGYWLRGSTWAAIREFIPEVHQRQGEAPYVNNFVFVHESRRSVRLD